MLAAVGSAAVVGIDALDVLVEVHVANGLPQWTLVGLAATAVKESRDRVHAALANSGFELPPRRVTVNLQPGDLPKTGTAFDLPIALALLAASGQIAPASLTGLCAIGELGLDGQLRAVRGVLAVARHVSGREQGLLVVPPANLDEACQVPRARVIAPTSLSELVASLRAGTLRPVRTAPSVPATDDSAPDLLDVVGQGQAVRALEIAAAGAHNVLLVGPPGAGKTMLARRMPGILPPLDEREALDVLAIHSVAGLLDHRARIASQLRRPFRAPHHSVSTAGLIGGGGWPRPGEVSLAHHGVLFLDELSLFPRHTLEALRQPLEDGVVTIARAAGTVRFPARFALIAASNPCPCGFAGCADRPCRCSVVDIERHRARLSGPLADRIDLHVHVQRVAPAALAAVSSVVAPDAQAASAVASAATSAAASLAGSSAAVRERVLAARQRQHQRYHPLEAVGGIGPASHTNANVPARLLVPAACLAPDARHLLVRAAERLTLSARAYHRVLRVARTIADLDGEATVAAGHVAEALRYRPVALDSAAESAA